MRPFGFNVIGHVGANAGLGVVARSVVKLILEKGYPLSVFDIDPGRGRGLHDATYSHLAVRDTDELPHGINLVILSITALPDILLRGRIRIDENTINAGFFWWELPALPEIWVKSLEQFDVLVAGSQYLRSTLERCVPGRPIVHAPHALQNFDGVQADRVRFGLPRNKTIFVCILEPTSDPIRKNPFGAIEAFRDAFAAEDAAHLVIKVNNVQADRDTNGTLARLQSLVAELGSRATLIRDVLPYRDVMQLFCSCDVFVSLHRAEGLGLGLMEAMALGKPVVATGWSGNMTFMNHVNSCLVGYRLIPVDGSLAVYSRAFLGQQVRWADPEVREAAAWMRALSHDAALRASIGRRAADDIRQYVIEAERGVFLDELRAVWERSQFLPRTRAMDVRTGLQALRDAQFDSHAGPIKKALRKSHAFLDRHLLWRLSSSHQRQ